MTIPEDPIILFSFINTRLRDDYTDLDDLCGGLMLDKEALVQKLAQAGFRYHPGQNQFR